MGKQDERTRKWEEKGGQKVSLRHALGYAGHVKNGAVKSKVLCGDFIYKKCKSYSHTQTLRLLQLILSNKAKKGLCILSANPNNLGFEKILRVKTYFDNFETSVCKLL